MLSRMLILSHRLSRILMLSRRLILNPLNHRLRLQNGGLDIV